MVIPNRLDNYLVIFCPYIETQNPNVNKTHIIAVYYGIRMDRSSQSKNFLSYVWLVVLCKYLLQCSVKQIMRAACSGYLVLC